MRHLLVPFCWLLGHWELMRHELGYLEWYCARCGCVTRSLDLFDAFRSPDDPQP